MRAGSTASGLMGSLKTTCRKEVSGSSSLPFVGSNRSMVGGVSSTSEPVVKPRFTGAARLRPETSCTEVLTVTVICWSAGSGSVGSMRTQPSSLAVTWNSRRFWASSVTKSSSVKLAGSISAENSSEITTLRPTSVAPSAGSVACRSRSPDAT